MYDSAPLDAIWQELERLKCRVGALEGLYTQVASLEAVLARYSVCLNELCPPRQLLTPIFYTVTLPQSFGAFVPYRVNFNNRVSDTVPPSVTTGPLWNVQLQEGMYDIEVQVQLDTSAWCAGGQVWLDLNLCGTVIRLNTQVMNQGNASVILYGKTQQTLTSPCKAYVTVGTDDTTVPVRNITGGFIRVLIGA
jgi:hypothetical protein